MRRIIAFNISSCLHQSSVIIPMSLNMWFSPPPTPTRQLPGFLWFGPSQRWLSWKVAELSSKTSFLCLWASSNVQDPISCVCFLVSGYLFCWSISSSNISNQCLLNSFFMWLLFRYFLWLMHFTFHVCLLVIFALSLEVNLHFLPSFFFFCIFKNFLFGDN